MESNEVKEQYVDQQSFGEKVAAFTHNVISVAPLIAALGIAIWWVFQGTVQITKLELTLVQQIGLTIVTVAMALSYRKLISVGGFKDAKNTKEYRDEEKAWTESRKNGNSSRREIEEFVKDICYNNLKTARRKNLENNGLLYENIFDELGMLRDLNYKHNKYNKKKNPNGYRFHQRYIIRKCVKMKVHIPDVFGVEKERYFGLKKQETEKSFQMKKDISSAVITVIIAFFSTSIMFAWIGFSIGSFIFALFQIVLWTGTGVWQRIRNYNFIIVKILPQITDNRMIIDEYMSFPDDIKQHYKDIVIEREARKFRKLIPMKGDN